MKKIFGVPYYAVIFKSKKSLNDCGYSEMAQKLLIEVEKRDGFLGADSVRNSEGLGITVSYWSTIEAIEKWKNGKMILYTAKEKIGAKNNGMKNIQFVFAQLNMNILFLRFFCTIPILVMMPCPPIFRQQNQRELVC